MPKKSRLKNPLQRNGLTRSERFLPALAPDFAPIDSRSFSDLLAYAWRFSAQLNYFDAASTRDGKDWSASGSWQELLKVDPAFYLSVIAAISPRALQKEFEYGLAECEEKHDLADWQNAIEDVFKIAAGIFFEIELFRKQFPVQSAARARIKAYIENRLQSLAIQLLGLYKTAISDHQTLENAFKDKLGDWQLDFSLAAPQNYDAEELRDQLVQDLRNLFETIVEIYASLITDAAKTVEQADRKSDHQPHIGLLFSFLKLFKNSQEQINGITARHLDFYYKDILQLKTGEARPDQAHVIFTPAKKTTSHLIKAQTLFKAGKDSEGKELLYGLREDFIVNRSVVAQLKNCFARLDTHDDHAKIITLHQGDAADTLLGSGEPLPEDDPKWPAFGNGDYPKARLGFGLASPILRLSEGKRTIAVTITVKDISPLLDVLFPDQASPSEVIPVNEPIFEIVLTGRKKWLPAEPLISIDAANNRLIIDLDLGFDFKEVADYRAEDIADEVDLGCFWPMLKVMINQGMDEPLYHGLSRLEIDKINLWVQAEDIRTLVLQNDLGSLKASKPFQPFGPLPVVGSNFYMGHRETFSKKLDSVKLNWNWVDLPEDPDEYYQSYLPKELTATMQAYLVANAGKTAAAGREKVVRDKSALSMKEEVAKQKADQGTPLASADRKNDAPRFSPTLSAAILINHEWQPLKDSLPLPLKPDAHNELSFAPTEFSADSEAQDFRDFGPNLSRGGIKITLKSPSFAFGHKDYPKLHAKAVAASVRQESPTDTLLDQLNPPVTPTFENFSLTYTASEEHTPFGDSGEFDFYHFHPFGFEKTRPLQLVPQYKEEGFLYIGLSGCSPPENVSILFQFAEGSGDPFADLPKSIKWSYLSASGWIDLPENKMVSDSTNGFLESGIITFPIVKEAVTDHPSMPAGLHWLRLAVSDNTHALHDLISIQAQAATVKFTDKDNAADHLKTSLAPGMIAKFKVRDPAIKSVSQPYASFGGRAAEESESFYNRTSERLRHKNRAVAIWDYEHMILEEFPDIYKVKCLNHTSECSEISPGNVLLVVIPDLQQKNSRYPLRPAVAQSRLQEIEQFLTKKASAHADIKVVNPLYESIRINGTVTFHKKYQGDKGFYKQQLHGDLTRMLTPWLYGAKEISFAGRIHRSAIINFIEELEYIDYLTGFEVTHLVDGASQPVLEEVVATTSRSILVSHDTHLISFAE